MNSVCDSIHKNYRSSRHAKSQNGQSDIKFHSYPGSYLQLIGLEKGKITFFNGEALGLSTILKGRPHAQE